MRGNNSFLIQFTIKRSKTISNDAWIKRYCHVDDEDAIIATVICSIDFLPLFLLIFCLFYLDSISAVNIIYGLFDAIDYKKLLWSQLKLLGCY